MPDLTLTFDLVKVHKQLLQYEPKRPITPAGANPAALTDIFLRKAVCGSAPWPASLEVAITFGERDADVTRHATLAKLDV